MSARRQRYLAFIDYLGTEELYNDPERNADLIEDRRSELEHAIQVNLQRSIAVGDIEVGVLSDTALIAGTGLKEVLASSAKLFDFVLRKSLVRGKREDLRLLRGGVAKGVELRSTYLPPTKGVSTIPFFDGSLAVAYQVEGIRKGSRLFLNKTLAMDDMREVEEYVFEWTSLTGCGRPDLGTREFLWPAYALAGRPRDLFELLQECFIKWRGFLREQSDDPNEYRRTLYHFDETVKCVVRSFLAFHDRKGVEEVVADFDMLLPRNEDTMDDCNIRYIWGIWFQLLFVICRLDLVEAHQRAIQSTLDTLERRNYLQNFAAETFHPDYAVMRPLLRNRMIKNGK